MAVERSLFSQTTPPQTALVVGASRGIGLGVVQQLLQDDRFGTVYGTYRRPESAQGLLSLTAQYPQLTCLPMDVTDEASIAEAIAQLQAQSPHLHRAVYCVGLLHDGDLQPEKSLRQITGENLMRSLQTNAFGAVLLAKHLMPLFKHDQPSLFAALSAKVGSIGDNRLGGWYGYRASKAALNMLIKTASLEYARRSPNTILALLHPGTTDTQLSEPFQRGVPPEKLFSVERTVTQLMAVMDGLTPADSGEFFSWDGTRLPW
ncbi:SDR family NAD(P)-dependent oxidoreductase [Nodosilinea sp. E11]|uniref:SDR family NAD(P)-dependent oxidoreductase n=1 Tax=Nodosilinea sp. E11 TaxID=3037479 RepID=UPI0029346B88|nr:SDR family NAD(P)-dependent oxidoreductase [Nodosilinea sp. E11]WOD39368.1 SDR family NAD(P)-dependent oxidoreductase [Nodosilinea sp. E11]